MKIWPVPVVFGLLLSASLYAQAAPLPSGIPTGTELQNIERTLAKPDLSGEARHDALVRLARLRQLSGDMEGAATNWIEGAAANPGKRDDAALTAGAFCLAASGEWDRAAATLKPLLTCDNDESRPPDQVMLLARYLDACAQVWNAGNSASLAALADDAEYAPLKSVIYYTLWKTGASNGDTPGGVPETWKARLLAEFPNSPEGRIAATEGSSAEGALASSGPAGNSVGARPSPLWLLYPGRDSFSLTPQSEPTPAGARPAAVSSAARPAPSPSNAPAGPSSPNGALPANVGSSPNVGPSPNGGTSPNGGSLPGGSGEKLLQAGLFRGEANARALMERITKAGFSASLLRRVISGVEHWAVTVPAGQSVTGTIKELKNAGFDSFPLN